MKFYLIYNPTSGYRKAVKALEKVKPIFEKADAELNIIETKHSRHATELATQLDFDGYDGLCVIGGDGTFHEVVNGMLLRNDGQKLPLGFIPGGTGNSFMLDFGLTEDRPEVAVEIIVGGKTRPVDIIKMKINDVTKYSINLIGWGMINDIGRTAEKFRWLGENRYLLASIVEILRNKPRKAKIDIDIDGTIDIEDFMFAIACNSVHVGKGMKMAPKAKVDDGLMDLIVVRHTSKFETLKMLPSLYKGEHINHPSVECFQTKSFRIIPEKEGVLNIDGEMLGSTPIEGLILDGGIEMFAK